MWSEFILEIFPLNTAFFLTLASVVFLFWIGEIMEVYLGSIWDMALFFSLLYSHLSSFMLWGRGEWTQASVIGHNFSYTFVLFPFALVAMLH